MASRPSTCCGLCEPFADNGRRGVCVYLPLETLLSVATSTGKALCKDASSA